VKNRRGHGRGPDEKRETRRDEIEEAEDITFGGIVAPVGEGAANWQARYLKESRKGGKKDERQSPRGGRAREKGMRSLSPAGRSERGGASLEKGLGFFLGAPKQSL